jgi:hypothetical protein
MEKVWPFPGIFIFFNFLILLGTMIEPTLEFGNSFLNVLQDRLKVPFGNRELEFIKELYMKRKEFSGSEKIQGKLDKVFDALNNVEPDLAEKLLKSI